MVRSSQNAREVLRQTGELWRDYTKIRLLGDGTYSKVWLVSSKHTGEQFAAKEVTLQPSSTSRTGHGAGRRKEGAGRVVIDSLTEEVAALRECSHPNVVRTRLSLHPSLLPG